MEKPCHSVALATLFLCYISCVFCKSNESRLIKTLLQDYDPVALPVHNPKTDVVNLSIGLHLLQIIRVSEKYQSITVSVWLHFKWEDVHLRWEPLEFGNISEIRLPPHRAWRPDIQLYNTATNIRDFKENTEGTNLIIYSAGSVLHVPGLTFTSACKMDVTWFPFDQQACDFKLGSWTYSGNQLNLTLGVPAADLKNMVENGEWTVLELSPKLEVLYYDCCVEPYVTTTYTLHIKRRSLYYFFNLIVPCGLIGFLALLGFTLPPDSKEKLTLGVTVLFSLIVFLNMIATTIPANSHGMPLLGTYFNCVMMTIAMSVVSTIVVNLNEKRVTNELPELRGKTRTIFLHWLPKLLGMSSSYKSGKVSASVRFDDEEDFSDKRKVSMKELLKMAEKVDSCPLSQIEIRGQWRFVALVVDRFCFLVSFVVSAIAVVSMIFKALN